MATFKVGQRVRVISSSSGLNLVGREGVITRAGDAFDWIVKIPGTHYMPELAPDLFADEWGFYSRELTPLTDPNAERFIESLKKLAREPLPLTKEKA